METKLNSLLDWLSVWVSRTIEFAEFWWSAAVESLQELLQPSLRAAGLTEPTDQTLSIALMGLILGAIAAVLLLRTWLRRRRSPARASLMRLTRRPRVYGYAAVLVLLTVFGGWSILAPLAGASMAPGVVSPDGSRKTVEHFEGGIIRSIHVKEGDQVAAGSPLFTLENVQAMARYREMRERYLHLRAIEARLLAERAVRDAIEYPEELTAAPGNEAALAMEGQTALFHSRRNTLRGHVDILEQRILQLDEQNIGLQEVINSKLLQKELIGEEIEGVQALFDLGLERNPRLLALKRAEAEIDSSIAASRARIAENRERAGETEIQLLTLYEQALERSNAELADVQRQLAEIQSELPSREDVLARTVVRAPIDGTVMNVHVTTESGVIRPGEALLEIVPANSSLVIDAKIRPTDIERVRSGMDARVILSAYRQRKLPLIHGVLRSVSADRLEEDRTGEPYYLAKVEVNPEDIEGLSGVELVPGMPAEIMILDGEQTLLEYLLDPFLNSFDRSFREG